MPDYIPRVGSEFNDWQSNFIDYVTNNAGNMGLTPEDLAPLTAAQSSWQTVYNDTIAAEAALSKELYQKGNTVCAGAFSAPSTQKPQPTIQIKITDIILTKG